MYVYNYIIYDSYTYIIDDDGKIHVKYSCDYITYSGLESYILSYGYIYQHTLYIVLRKHFFIIFLVILKHPLQNY